MLLRTTDLVREGNMQRTIAGSLGAAVLLALGAAIGRTGFGDESGPVESATVTRAVMASLDIDRHGRKVWSVSLHFPGRGLMLTVRIDARTERVLSFETVRCDAPWWKLVRSGPLQFEPPPLVELEVSSELVDALAALADLEAKLRAERGRVREAVAAAGLLEGVAEQAGPPLLRAR
jgi:hypothetical protein